MPHLTPTRVPRGAKRPKAVIETFSKRPITLSVRKGISILMTRESSSSSRRTCVLGQGEDGRCAGIRDAQRLEILSASDGCNSPMFDTTSELDKNSPYAGTNRREGDGRDNDGRINC